jgi:AcrR family transcriptional regulator
MSDRDNAHKAAPEPAHADGQTTVAPTPGRRGYTGFARDPERTVQSILAAATTEFAEKGLGGARVDAIAERAGVNKRMLYHYFGDKDGLFLAVLENAYAAIRAAEVQLQLDRAEPVESLRTLARFTWQYFLQHPEFLSLLATENLHRAEHLHKSSSVHRIHSSFLTTLREILSKGERQGLFKKDIDPVYVYLTIASLGAFYLSNRYTLSVIFTRDLSEAAHLDAWGEHIITVILAYVRATPSTETPSHSVHRR